MRKLLAWSIAWALSGLLAVMFVRALCGQALAGNVFQTGAGAFERIESGRSARVSAACGPALHPEPMNSALGELPTGAPEFTLHDYAGRPIALSSLKGRVVLLNFWATWCPTCVAEMASLERLALAEQGQPFTLLAVSVDESWDAVRRFFARGTPLTVLLDPKKSLPGRYGTEKFPETFLIDREGRIRYYVVSDRSWDAADVKACIDALIKG